MILLNIIASLVFFALLVICAGVVIAGVWAIANSISEPSGADANGVYLPENQE